MKETKTNEIIMCPKCKELINITEYVEFLKSTSSETVKKEGRKLAKSKHLIDFEDEEEKDVLKKDRYFIPIKDFYKLIDKHFQVSTNCVNQNKSEVKCVKCGDEECREGFCHNCQRCSSCMEHTCVEYQEDLKNEQGGKNG